MAAAVTAREHRAQGAIAGRLVLHFGKIPDDPRRSQRIPDDPRRPQRIPEDPLDGAYKAGAVGANGHCVGHQCGHRTEHKTGAPPAESHKGHREHVERRPAAARPAGGSAPSSPIAAELPRPARPGQRSLGSLLRSRKDVPWWPRRGLGGNQHRASPGEDPRSSRARWLPGREFRCAPITTDVNWCRVNYGNARSRAYRLHL
ncbi:Hypothetical predicted protein [Marmota monax]|uniref:Uncharacterized protein n=1 Tax=Marmota monax TaxID=9995 RepID=A0A5E4A1X3_MARMO|nr:Hypothetical predicted protein [Marmota monax]